MCNYKCATSSGCADLNFDCQLFIGSQRVLIGQRQEADLIQSIGGIGDQLPEEDLRHTKKTSDISIPFRRLRRSDRVYKLQLYFRVI